MKQLEDENWFPIYLISFAQKTTKHNLDEGRNVKRFTGQH